MTEGTRGSALQTIFSFFLGLMVTTFVGVGAYTFHPPPHEELTRQVRDLSRQEQAIRNAKPERELTTADREQLQQIDEGRYELTERTQASQEDWGRSTSIILIVFATLVMAISLIRADRLPVISNGLLLGGVFTMVYGVGWIVATDTSVTRFVVMTIGLAITLALGYVRFVRGVSAGPTGTGLTSVEASDIETRLQDLEGRMNQAATALGQKRGGA
jgi:hypothetical protein